MIWQYLFWISVLLVFFNYAGYVVPVVLINRLKRSGKKPEVLSDHQAPTVSFIVAAYNEEDCIREKIENSLRQDYPAHKIEFLFITDGSTDDTVNIVREYSPVQSLHQPERKGKSAALNRAVSEARNEILIFSDANTVLNPEAVRNIARHYQDPKVGGVAGEKKVLQTAATGNEVGEGEGLYWKYESFLKRQDAAFYSVVGAAGELVSFRKDLFETLPDNVILDDFVSSLRCAQKGFRIRYEPEAYAMELPSFSLLDERKRKVRIAAGGFQAIGMLTPLLAFWRYPRLSYLYISHRVLRWTLSPLGMLLAFIANGILCFSTPGLPYKVLFAIQLAFYGTAILAYVFPALAKPSNKSLGSVSKLVRLANYFVFMNVSVVLGFFRFLRGRQSASWDKAKRAQANFTV